MVTSEKVTIGSKQYSITEVGGDVYEAMLQRLVEKRGANWADSWNITAAAMLLEICLKDSKGNSPTFQDCYTLKLRLLKKYSGIAAELNGVTEPAKARIRKN